MLSLTEFLLARIAEDEATARAWPDDTDGVAPDGRPWRDPTGHFIWQPKARALAECEAKRRIVERCALILEAFSAQNGGPGRPLWHDVNRRERSHADATLAALALPYADHPDYQEDCRP